MKEYTLSEGEIQELRSILSEESGHSAHYIRTEITKNLLSKIFIKPLFTTVDGKDIFIGDSVYAVSDDFQLLYTSYADESDRTIRSFSTKVAAEKYIEQNKPKYSEKDILEAVNNWSHSSISIGDINIYLEK